jgi:hypothetical protein
MGGMRKDEGVRIEVFTLLGDREDVDMGVGNGEAARLDVVVVIRDDTEETVVEFGWRLAGLLLEIDQEECGRLGVLMGVAVGDLLAIDMVCDWRHTAFGDQSGRGTLISTVKAAGTKAELEAAVEEPWRIQVTLRH